MLEHPEGQPSGETLHENSAESEAETPSPSEMSGDAEEGASSATADAQQEEAQLAEQRPAGEAGQPPSEPAAENDASVAAEGLEASAEQYPDIAEKSASIIAVFEGLTEKLGTAGKTKEALEADLAAVRDEAAGLQGKFTFASERLDEIRARCGEQEAEIRDLRKANQSLEQALTVMTTRHDAARNELSAVKRALGRIHEAAQASRHSPKGQGRPAEGEQA